MCAQRTKNRVIHLGSLILINDVDALHFYAVFNDVDASSMSNLQQILMWLPGY